MVFKRSACERLEHREHNPEKYDKKKFPKTNIEKTITINEQVLAIENLMAIKGDYFN